MGYVSFFILTLAEKQTLVKQATFLLCFFRQLYLTQAAGQPVQPEEMPLEAQETVFGTYFI